MSRLLLILLIAARHGGAQQVNPDTTDVFERLTVAKFAGSGTDLIQAMTSDRDGNVYIAGSTTSPDLKMVNAAQPAMGESQILVSTDRGVTWKKLTNLPAGDPLTVEAHPQLPQVVFAGSDAGIYKSTDGGGSWRLVYKSEANLTVSSIAFDPSDASFVYGCGYGGVVVSKDAGETWTRLTAFPPSFPTGPYGPRITTGPSGSVLVGAALSRDHGATWVRIAPPTPFLSLVATFDPYHPGTIFVATGAGTTGQLWVTPDWGATWSGRTQPGDAIQQLLLDPDKTDVLYALTLTGFYRSDNGGTSWTGNLVAYPYFGLYYRSRVVGLPRACGGGLLGADFSQLQRSPDFGTTWERVNLAPVVDLSASGCVVYAARTITTDAFVAKLNSDGEVLWSTYWGDTGRDVPAAVSVNDSGTVFVTGVTSSASSFIASYDAEGNLLYSKAIGNGIAMGIAADPVGNAYVTGYSNAGPQIFVVKFSPDGSEVYTSSQDAAPVGGVASIAVDRNGSVVRAGFGSLVRLDPAGDVISEDSTGPFHGATQVAIDTDGNTYLAGATTSQDFPVSGFSTPRSHRCGSYTNGIPVAFEGDTYVVKLDTDFQLVYSALLAGECWSKPSALTVGTDGTVTIALQTQSAGFPLRRPVAIGGFIPRGIVAQLSPDGASLTYSTQITSLAIAVTPDNSIFAPLNTYQHDPVVKLTPGAPAGVAIDMVSNAFSGASYAIAPGSLVSIEGGPFDAEGARVLFDGSAAKVISGSATQLICIAPSSIKDRTNIQVASGGEVSNVVQVMVSPVAPQVMTREMFQVDRYAELPAARARNEDGAENDEAHPAAQGSTVTFYLTGVGNEPVPALYHSWDGYQSPLGGLRPATGFGQGVYELTLRLPPRSADVVVSLPLILSTGRPARSFLIPPNASRAVGIYVR